MSSILRNPIFIGVFIVWLLLTAIAIWFDHEPDQVPIVTKDQENPIIGVATTQALIDTVEALWDKPGGYLTNDVIPPSIFMDNVPNWEFGVLQQVRDLAKALRNDYSRSQTQSVADEDLEIAEPKFNVDSEAWMFPSAEGEYGDGVKSLKKYLARLQDPNQQDAQFYARSDNLSEWLSLVEKRLGDLSQRLSSSRAQDRVNTDLAGEANAKQSTQSSSKVVAKTSWFEIDDNFYEARGTAWALIHYLKAVEVDFRSVLEEKNALPSLQQIIIELEATQQPLLSPMVLNGRGMGMFANHSLVMSSYITRANTAISDLRRLFPEGKF